MRSSSVVSNTTAVELLQTLGLEVKLHYVAECGQEDVQLCGLLHQFKLSELVVVIRDN